MNLKIEITEAINGYRVDISDYEESDFHHENTERLVDALSIIKRYITDLELTEWDRLDKSLKS
jgi:hypothetical protein